MGLKESGNLLIRDYSQSAHTCDVSRQFKKQTMDHTPKLPSNLSVTTFPEK
jgi:hypothetical protein